MTATNQGSLTIAQTCPEYASALEEVGDALQTLRNVVIANEAALSALTIVCNTGAGLGDIQASLDASIGAQLDANIAAQKDLKASLDAVVDAGAYVGDLSATISASLDLLAGVDAPQFLLDAQLSMDDSLNASIDAKADFGANVSAGLDLATGNSDRCVLGILAIAAALVAATVAANSAIARYHSTVSLSSATGVDVIHFAGDAADLGTDIDSVLGVSGNITSVVLSVPDTNPTTLANFKLFYGVT